jgi:hypothetical protein
MDDSNEIRKSKFKKNFARINKNITTINSKMAKWRTR